MKYNEKNKDRVSGPSDTPAQMVLQKTYKGENFAQVKQEFDAYIKYKQLKESLMVFKD